MKDPREDQPPQGQGECFSSASSEFGIETVVEFSTEVSVTTVEGWLNFAEPENSAKRGPFALPAHF
jgi:hypothetical protein